MKLTSVGRLLAAIGLTGLVSHTALASLTVSYQFNGTGNWSIDAWGTGNVDNFVSALVPSGSTVEKAFLYSSTYGGSGTPTITFNSTFITAGAWTAGGITGINNLQLQAYRADVTSLVAAKVGSGGGTFNFTIDEGANSGTTDGEVLAVIFSNPAEQTRTIAFLDGFSATTGDTTSLNLASALTAPQLANPSFQAIMSLGIGFSFQGNNQSSTVDVNGQRLTSSAGGSDDGSDANGALITAGGLGDSTANPADPFAIPPNNGGTRYDDELYSLTPFLSAGTTSIKIDTRNSSGDDNIFFAGFNITAAAGVNQPPPPPTNNVPDSGSTLGLFGLAVAALAAARRFVK